MDQRERGTDTVEALRTALEGYVAENLWTSLPGYVVSYDPTKQTMVVQSTVMINVRNRLGNTVWTQIPTLLDVPVVFPSGSAFGLSWVPQANDEVLVIFACRCIDGWWNQSGIQIQAQARLHSLSDGFAIPGPKSRPNALTVVQPTDSIRLGKLDGSAYIEIMTNGTINIVAPGGLMINGVVLTTGEVTIQTSVTPLPLSQHLHGSSSTPLVPFTGVPLP